MWRKSKWFRRLGLVAFLCLLGFTGGGASNVPKEPSARVEIEKRLVNFVFKAEIVSIPKNIEVAIYPHAIYKGLFWKEYAVYEHISPVSTRDFVIEYAWHKVRILMYRDSTGELLPSNGLIMEVANRKEFATPGYRWETITMGEWGFIGEVTGKRSYYIFNSAGILISPDYPTEVIQAFASWYSPSQEVIEDMFDTELQLWIKVMEGVFDGT